MKVLSGGEASADATGKRVISGRYMLARRETGPFGAAGKTVDPYSGKTLAERALQAYTGVGIGEAKRKSRFTLPWAGLNPAP
jgi:hypothetical protein